MKQLLKSMIGQVARRAGYEIVPKFPLDFDEDEIKIIQAVEPYTMTTPQKVYALMQAVKYIVKSSIPGDIVECGVWKGGSIMVAAKTLLSLNNTDRHLYLFDTFEGMVKPGSVDVSHDQKLEAYKIFEERKINDSIADWCYAPLDEVKNAVYSVGYAEAKIHFVKGKVEETIPGAAPSRISLLRLDTDWYESTRHELIHLFPRLSRGGVIIIDDYGYWQGARQATDEYISQNNICLLLNRIDGSGRIGVKL